MCFQVEVSPREILLTLEKVVSSHVLIEPRGLDARLKLLYSQPETLQTRG